MTATELGNGLHYALSREQYDRLRDRLSASVLLEMRESAKHFKATIDGEPKKKSKALDFGTAFHHYILERDTFEFHYTVSQTCDATITSKNSQRCGERCGAPGIGRDGEKWLCGTHGKHIVPEENCISPSDMYTIERMAESLKDNPIVNVMRRRGGHEATVLWEFAGVPLKSRLDKLVLREPQPCIVDLKTVGSKAGNYDKFKSAIAKHGYHIRAAMYVDAVKQQCGVLLPYIFVVCEKEPPYCVGTYQLADEAEAYGRYWYRQFIRNYKAHLESGSWPGWSVQGEDLKEKVIKIGIPKYAMEGQPEYVY